MISPHPSKVLATSATRFLRLGLGAFCDPVGVGDVVRSGDGGVPVVDQAVLNSTDPLMGRHGLALLPGFLHDRGATNVVDLLDCFRKPLGAFARPSPCRPPAEKTPKRSNFFDILGTLFVKSQVSPRGPCRTYLGMPPTHHHVHGTEAMNSLKRVSRRLKVRKSRQLEALEPRHLLATVGGVIAADTVWTRDDSPYEVISDVTVLENVTLEIEPGVTVLFDQNTGLNVNGRLVAEGSAFDRITFDRASGAPDWDGIVFVDTLADSRITFADMRYGDNQGEAINVNHSRLLLDNIVWEGTTGTILELEHPSVIVRNSHFPVSNGSEIIHGEYIENDEYSDHRRQHL